VAAADAQEDNIVIAFQTLGGAENGLEIMRPPKISGIANNEFVLEPHSRRSGFSLGGTGKIASSFRCNCNLRINIL